MRRLNRSHRFLKMSWEGVAESGAAALSLSLLVLADTGSFLYLLNYTFYPTVGFR